jgi:flagellar basal body-associated protein FliL
MGLILAWYNSHYLSFVKREIMSGYRVGNIALIVAIMVAFVYIIYGSFFKESTKSSSSMFSFAPSSKTEPKPITNPNEVGLEQILINLGKGEYRFLKAEISVEAPSKNDVKQIQKSQEALRRMVLHLASQEDVNALATPSGKEAFKARIIKEAETQLGLRLNAVYFRNFVLAE